jgi:hypothetical protein
MRKFKHTLLLRFTQLKTFIKSIKIEGISETTWR